MIFIMMRVSRWQINIIIFIMIIFMMMMMMMMVMIMMTMMMMTKVVDAVWRMHVSPWQTLEQTPAQMTDNIRSLCHQFHRHHHHQQHKHDYHPRPHHHHNHHHCGHHLRKCQTTSCTDLCQSLHIIIIVVFMITIIMIIIIIFAFFKKMKKKNNNTVANSLVSLAFVLFESNISWFGWNRKGGGRKMGD